MQTFKQHVSGISFEGIPLKENLISDIEKLLTGHDYDTGGSTARIWKIEFDRPSTVPHKFDTLKKQLDKANIPYTFNTAKSSKGTLTIPDPDLGKDGKHYIFFKPSSSAEKGPNATQWESLIAVGVNKLKKKSSWDKGEEWEIASKYWDEYGSTAEDVAQDFIKQLSVDSLKGTGKSSAPLNPKWRGTNKTPKTDIISSKHNISLKKTGGSQLMSASKEEVISTVEAAQETFGEANPAAIKKLVKIMEDKLVKLSEMDSVSSIDKLKKKETLSDKEIEQIAELESARIGAKDVETEFNKVFSSKEFLGHFCFEAATGDLKFKDTWPSATVVCTFDPNKRNLKNVLFLDSPKKAGQKLANGNQFYVSFKSSAGSPPYLAFRSKKKSKKAMQQTVSEAGIPSLKTILMEEISNYGMLTEEFQQLDEFAILNNLSKKLKDVASSVRNTVKKVWKAIIERLKKALAMIAKLGKKALSSLRRFFGLDMSNATLSKTGGIYPVDELIFNG